MKLTRVEGPQADPVTLDQVKLHLAVDADDFDALLEVYVSAVTAHLDGRDGILGLALIQQSWDLSLDCFSPRIDIPLPPLQSITSITYLDADGDTQVLDPAAYQVTVLDGPQRSSIVPAYGTRWPSTRRTTGAVVIRFVAGYPSDGNSPPDLAANVPAPIKMAVLEMVADLFANRETVGEAQTVIPMPASAKALLAQYRSWAFA